VLNSKQKKKWLEIEREKKERESPSKQKKREKRKTIAPFFFVLFEIALWMACVARSLSSTATSVRVVAFVFFLFETKNFPF
jgi:hypothetical protein